jgi:hypothetical protein
MVEAQVRANKNIKSTELQATLRASGIDVKRRTVNNAKLQVKATMAMGNIESYQLLPYFLKAFEVWACKAWRVWRLGNPLKFLSSGLSWSSFEIGS